MMDLIDFLRFRVKHAYWWHDSTEVHFRTFLCAVHVVCHFYCEGHDLEGKSRYKVLSCTLSFHSKFCNFSYKLLERKCRNKDLLIHPFPEESIYESILDAYISFFIAFMRFWYLE